IKPEKVEITDENCINSINSGKDNLFQFNITGTEISKSYVSGGFVRVDYQISSVTLPTENTIRYYFPGIDGQINLYDSFYVPGKLKSMKIHLVFRNDFNTSLKIGNKVAMEAEGKEGIQVIDLDNSYLSSLLDYDEISNKTIPLRLVFDVPKVEGTADVVLITDVSGSMNWTFESDKPGIDRKCYEDELYSVSTKRISLARCLDINFTKEILSVPGNRIALVAFDGTNNCINSTPLTNDFIFLSNIINNYKPLGGTCIACAINEAYKILNQSSDNSRQKFIVLMTDGLANTYPVNENTSKPCMLESGLYSPSGCYEQVGNKSANDTIKAACRANRDLGAIIHSVGFGPIVTCDFSNQTLKNVSDCGNGIFAVSDKPEELARIYATIAKEILEKNYERQRVILTKDVRNMTLYPESYIEFTFEPSPKIPIYGGITINLETKITDCCGNVYIPDKYTVERFRITSYSGDYWTDNVTINNKQVFKLSDFGSSYTTLGDPFTIEIPTEFVSKGNNKICIRTGESPTKPNPSCSKENKAIYTVTLRAMTGYSPVLPQSYENKVKVYYNKGDYNCIPDGFVEIGNSGAPEISVDELDASKNAFHYALKSLLDLLNFVDCAGNAGSANDPIDLEITPEFRVESTEISNVPSLWGPMDFTLMVWT
ncbi:MAG: VWA domain-containing protein, partial [Candidatus Aenigmatarchaeota archaeon]